MIHEKIKEVFLENLNLLSLVSKSHFVTRLYRVSGDSSQIVYVKEYFESTKNQIKKDIDNLENSEYITKRSEELFGLRKNLPGEKEEKRNKLFDSRKEVLFYYNLIVSLNYWRTLGVCDEYYEKGIEFLKKINFESLILDGSLIKVYGTQLCEYVYSLYFMGVRDLRDRYKEKYLKVFSADFSGYEFVNKVYGLTHFILAGSDYYQKFVSANEFEWVLEYFRKDIDKIIATDNVDLITEIGLCFKLCKFENSVVDKVREYIEKSFDSELGYFKRKSGSFDDSEHANSIVYLFLSKWDKLLEGPKLGNL